MHSGNGIQECAVFAIILALFVDIYCGIQVQWNT
jgi:hypothetical protein